MLGRCICMCVFRGPILWGHDGCATDQSGPILWIMYKGPILWGHDACYNEPDVCTEDQSYGTVHVATCTYARSQVKDLCQV